MELEELQKKYSELENKYRDSIRENNSLSEKLKEQTTLMMQRYTYEDLEKHFTSPKRISPFYDDNVKIPRKLKKKVKCFCGIHYKRLTNGQRLWYYMENSNPDYKRYLIKMICTSYNVA